VDPVTGQTQHYRHEADNPDSLAGNDIRALAVAGDGGLWIGTRQFGVDRLDPATGRFAHYRPVSGDAVFSLLLERDGVLWVGTTTGLNRLDTATGKATRYTTAQGLPNDTINAILPAPNGQVWVSTNQG
jgi:streptogramin lyase